MPVKQLAAEVLATPGVNLGGKTPEATIAAILYTSPLFKKVGRGVVALAPGAKDEAKKEPTKRPRLAARKKPAANTPAKST
jgi:hypothetical protein